jgi:FixJ family two-component response regulator
MGRRFGDASRPFPSTRSFMPNVIGIVDNDAAILGSIDAMLQASGYETELFSSGEALLDVVATSAATCLVIDIHLSGISGIETARRLAAHGSSVPIIFVSGQLDDETQKLAAEVGCIAILRKPFAAARLFEAIDSVIHRQDGHR